MIQDREKTFHPPRRSAPNDSEGLEEEIAIVREVIHLVHNLTRGQDDVKVMLRILNSLSGASIRLAGLLRAQRGISERAASSNTLTERMDRILVGLAKEKGLIS